MSTTALLLILGIAALVCALAPILLSRRLLEENQGESR